MPKIVKHRTPLSLIAVGALVILGLPLFVMLGAPIGAHPSAMPAATLEQIRDANAEIVSDLVVELADPALTAQMRRRKEAQLKAAEERLIWAQDYLRLGHDPDLAPRSGVLDE